MRAKCKITFLFMIMTTLWGCKEDEPTCTLHISIQINSLKATAIIHHGVGPYTYLWSTGATTNEIAGPFTGEYSVTVTDFIGCSKTASATFSAACGSLHSVLDTDGKSYNVIAIGNQCWTVYDLNRLSGIPQVEDSIQWASMTTPAWCYYEHDFFDYPGRLYNWYAVNIVNICPPGWHIPTDADWDELINFLNGEAVAGEKLKVQELWDGNNSSGFQALPAGYRSPNGTYWSFNSHASYWSSSVNSLDTTTAWSRSLNSGSTAVFRGANDKRNGYRCRCVKD